MTPSCAEIVAPAAVATDRVRTRPNRSASGEASATIPAVAVTLNWKPTDQTSHGSSTRRPSTAPERIDAVVRGLPDSTPTSARHAITPARSTEGSAPVRIVKNATAPKPTANLGHRESLRSAVAASTGASTMATFPPDTTSRWLRPDARKSRSRPGSSCESSPRSSPKRSPASSGGNTRSIELPTTSRVACVARTNALVDGPRRVNVCSWSCAGIPLRSSASANSSSSGTRSVPSRRTSVSSARVRHGVAPADPDR